MNIVFFGAPCAGKGTQSKLLAIRYKIPHITIEEIFEENIEQKTPLGIKVGKIIKIGGLVDDDTICKLVKDKLNKIGPGWILDGFPHSMPQVKFFIRYTNMKHIEVNYLMLRINKQIVANRIKTRSRELGRPEDASEDAIAKRIRIFEEKTRPCFNQFSNKIKLFDGKQKISPLFKEIHNYLDHIEFLKKEEII